MPIPTQRFSHLLTIHFRPKSSSTYYFDSYGIVLFVPHFLAFIRRNCTPWDHTKRQWQSLTSDVCGKYCSLFAIYMERGYTPQQFVALFGAKAADGQVERIFTAEFGAEVPRGGWGQCCRSRL